MLNKLDGLDYRFDDLSPIDEVLRLYRQTGWTAKRSPEMVERMLRQTPVLLTVWDGERLVGFARVITDDIYRAFIEDVIVDADYRGRGVGKQIMQALIQRLDHIEEVVLNCNDDLVTFYESLGFNRKFQPYMNIWKGK
jgi:predicted GNAT family N-acyltransferase